MASGLRRRAVVVPVAIALVAGGGAVAWGSSDRSGSGYRTATVGRGDVQQLLSLTGTVHVVNQAKARFRTAGTVAAVKVTVGQTVTKGQLLATMDSGRLQDAVTKAKATLSKAKATLESDSSSSAATPTPTASATPSATRSGSPLLAAQQAAERALQRAELALAAATAVCATPAPSASATPSVTPSTTATEVPAASAPGSGSCPAALASALRAQQTAAQAQQDLSRVLQSASREVWNPTTGTATPTPASSPSQASRNPAQGSSGVSAAARITTDTAAVSAAEVALAEAEKDLAAVSLRAPLSGIVASIPWTPGGSAAVGDAIVILGRGAVDVTVEVPATAIRSVRVGLPATVRADGASKSVSGVVTQIGLLPTDSSSESSSSSTTTYPVTVRVEGAGLVEGSSASVGIVVKTVRDVITVPNSALHGSTVEVLRDGKVSTVRVQTGAAGALVTEVTSGLEAGQSVVLADLGEPLPTSSTTNNNRGLNGGLNGARGGFAGPPPGVGGGPVVIRRGG